MLKITWNIIINQYYKLIFFRYLFSSWNEQVTCIVHKMKQNLPNSYCWISLLGHTRKISIPNCVEFRITTNACRGYCESWAVPSPADTVMINPNQRITSVGQCCNIMETEDVSTKLLRLNVIFWSQSILWDMTYLDFYCRICKRRRFYVDT